MDGEDIVWSVNPHYTPPVIREYLGYDELRFAERLVYYVMSTIIGSTITMKEYSSSKSDTPCPFNEAVKNAVNCILCYRHRKRESYPITDQLRSSRPSEEKYKMFAHKVFWTYTSKCFEITNFLHFCVDISLTAVVFYCMGLRSAPTLATQFILHYLNVYKKCPRNVKPIKELNRSVEAYPILSNESFNEDIDKLRRNLELSKSPMKEMASPADSYPASDDAVFRIAIDADNSGNVHSSDIVVCDSSMRAEAAERFTPTGSATRYRKRPKVPLIFPRSPSKDLFQADPSSSSNPSAEAECVARYAENLNLESTRPRSLSKDLFPAGPSSSSNQSADAESVAKYMKNLKLELTLPLSRELGQADESSSLIEDEEAAEATASLNDDSEDLLDSWEDKHFGVSADECRFRPMTKQQLLESILKHCGT